MLKRYVTPFITCIVTVLVLCLLASIAYAADAAPKENSAQQLANIAFDFLKVIVTALGGYVAFLVGSWVKKKTGIDQEAQLNKWIREGILYAEEKSRNKIKEKMQKLTGSEKLEAAGKFVLELAKSQGVTKWTKDKVEAKIESWLGEARSDGGKPRLDGEASPDLPVS